MCTVTLQAPPSTLSPTGRSSLNSSAVPVLSDIKRATDRQRSHRQPTPFPFEPPATDQPSTRTSPPGGASEDLLLLCQSSLSLFRGCSPLLLFPSAVSSGCCHAPCSSSGASVARQCLPPAPVLSNGGRPETVRFLKESGAPSAGCSSAN